MFGFLKKNQKPVDSVVRPSQLSLPMPGGDKRKAIQMELLPVVLKDTLRICGLPADLLDCECRIIPVGPGQEEFHVSLIIRRWDEEFLKYAFAFERMLVRGLDRFDPTVNHSTYVLSWKFGPKCDCPYTTFPTANAGLTHLKTGGFMATETAGVRTGGRPAAPARAPAGDDGDGFAPTSISPLI